MSRSYAISIVRVLLALATIVVCYGRPPPTGEFPHHAELDTKGNVFLYWRYDDKSVTFELFCKTLGWVGFGFSPNGAMRGSDIAVGWVTSDGKTFFHDRYATGNSEPRIDKSQDWDLLSAGEKDGFTRLKFKRLRNTCDKEEDRIITDDTLRVIWAYHESDPSDSTRIEYHSSNRGSRSLYLFGQINIPDLPPDTKIHEFSLTDFAVPNVDTHYECAMFKMPEKFLTHKQHIIRFEPVYGSKEAEGILHHMIIYFCKTNPGDHLNGTTHECYTDQMPPTVMGNCENFMIGWAIGGGPVYIPEHAGYPVGYPGGPEFIRLEVHYDNPQLLEGIIDSSGMRLYYTSHLREYDYAMLEVGSDVPIHRQNQLIPPQLQDYRTMGYCHNECLKSFLPSEGVNMFMGQLHGHLTVRGIRARHWRDGVELKDLLTENNYDFNYQETRMLKHEVKLYPTDTLITECKHETMDRVNMTVGGFKSREEMCLTFIGYYPALNVSRCWTFPLRENLVKVTNITEWKSNKRDKWIVKSPEQHKGMDMIDVMNTMVDWKNQTFVDQLQYLSVNTTQQLICRGRESPKINGRQPPPVMRVPRPPEPDGCPKKPPRGSATHNAPFMVAILFGPLAVHILRALY